MSDRKDKGTVDFGTQDASYAEKIAAAKQKVPVGGVPMPPIPRFDQPPPDRTQGVQAATPAQAAQRILTPEEQAKLAQQGHFIPGVGAAYAANQPGARSLPPGAVEVQPQAQPGGFVNPPRPEGAGLRPETIEQLQAVAKANTDDDKAVDEDLKKTREELDELDNQFEYDEFGNKVRSLLNNKDRREAIEKRCEPMAIEDLIVQGEVRQRVPIVPGKFEPTFRSVGGQEDLYIKRRMSNERGSEQYILDKFSIMNLTSTLFALNGRPLPSHIDTKSGEPTDELFDAKMRILLRMPLTMLADLSVNYIWFQRRLQRLFVVDNLKGF